MGEEGNERIMKEKRIVRKGGILRNEQKWEGWKS